MNCDGHPLRDEYVDTVRFLFRTYAESLDPVRSLVLERFPRRENEKEEAWDRRIRSKYVDVCRFILPAASLANVGMTANARVLENMIRKMLSHELAEVRRDRREGQGSGTSRNPNSCEICGCRTLFDGDNQRIFNHSDSIPLEDERRCDREDWCTLISYDQDGENKVLAAALYPFWRNELMPKRWRYVKAFEEPERAKLAESLLGRLGKFDVPLRELEYSTYTFRSRYGPGRLCRVQASPHDERRLRSV